MIVSVKEGQFESNNSWMHVAHLSADVREYQVSELKANSEYTVHFGGILREQLGYGVLGNLTIRTLEDGRST